VLGGKWAAVSLLFLLAVEVCKGLIRRTTQYEVKILLVMVTVTGPGEIVFREERRCLTINGGSCVDWVGLGV
jgi:hypothetical protein